MIGGATYDLDELVGPPPVAFASGIDTLDSAMPGIRPGSLCAVVGMRGVGVTELVMTYVRRAGSAESRSRPALVFMNGHLPGDVLAQRLALDPGRSDAQSNIAVASWLATPSRGSQGRWDWVDATVTRADLVVYDTVDESFPALHELIGRRERVGTMRDLRDAARASAKAVIVTCRVAPSGPDLADVRQAWRTHPLHEAIMDAADTVITVVDATDAGHVQLVIESRLGRHRSVSLRVHPRTGRLIDPAGSVT